jgi:F-type H+-transporting ATPase subunit epsilon
MLKINLKIVSQEKELLQKEVDSLTITTTSGEITVLPKHAPLFSQVESGELIYREGASESSIVVSEGFIDINPDSEVTVMVDSATLARDISLQKAQDAVKAAKETMSKTQDQRELMMAEASLRQAMLEIKVAEKTKKARI